MKQYLHSTKDPLINDIINNDPISFPDTNVSNNSSDNAHAIYGCVFEISLLCIDVHKCNCCDIIVKIVIFFVRTVSFTIRIHGRGEY